MRVYRLTGTDTEHTAQSLLRAAMVLILRTSRTTCVKSSGLQPITSESFMDDWELLQTALEDSRAESNARQKLNMSPLEMDIEQLLESAPKPSRTECLSPTTSVREWEE